MITPSVVIFDLGKVLLNFDYGVAAKRLEARCKTSCDELRRLIDQSPLLLHYEANRLSTEQFFAEVQNVTGFSGDLCEFAGLFADIFTPIPPMVDLHRQLRARGVPAYIFSNTNDLAVRHIRERYPFFGNFDGYILSYEHSAMKPDPKLYEVVEKMTGRRGPELLYIDDRPENIATGSARGWQVILHESPTRTQELVERTGLLPALA